MRPTDFAFRLTAFLTQYLAAQRNLSPNTIRSYRDAFTLLLRYCRDGKGIPPERLTLDHLDAETITGFLRHLQEDRNCGTATVNQRLAALHAFFRYLQVEQPERLLQSQRILAIPFRRHARPAVGYLSAQALSDILKQPPLTTKHGRRDAVLLSVLYDTAARVQELIDLRVGHLRLDPPAYVCLTGKGEKMRAVPLMEKTVRLLKDYLREHRLDLPERSSEPVFQNRAGGHLSRSGVRYILAKYKEQARVFDQAIPDKVSPHTLRHSKAVHLLQSGAPLIVIRDVLGHVDVTTTEIYARVDLEMKRKALEKSTGVTPARQLPPWCEKPELLAWLRSL